MGAIIECVFSEGARHFEAVISCGLHHLVLIKKYSNALRLTKWEVSDEYRPEQYKFETECRIAVT